MRVIAGTYKGRRLTVPRGDAIRPTADRVREALFSILGARVEGAAVLDLFAGTGALAIEALSRGAASATLVDTDTRAAAANLDGVEGAQLVRREARAFLRSAPGQYDLVFLDPPYRDGPRLLAGLPVAAVLSPNGVVVSESDRRSPTDLPELDKMDERRYGDTLIRLYEH